MMPPWRDLFLALAAYGGGPESPAVRRDLAIARLRCGGADPQKTRWPGLCRLAMLAAHEVMREEAGGPRAVALGRAAWVIADIEQGDVGNMRLPTREAAAPHQYKDDD